MSFDINDELNKMFDLAVRQYEAKALTTSKDWQALQDIEERYDRAREDAQKRYRDEYATRVERARSDILSEKTIPTHDLRPPFGTNISDEDAVERQAHQRVRQGHMVDMAGIDQSQSRDIERLMAEAVERRTLQGWAQEDFTHAADRRSGQDRRRSIKHSQD